MTPLQTIVRLPSGLHLRIQALGNGPALVMCHESPRSSSALLPLAQRLADQFTCIMIDTPGFGLSDPMPMSRPEISDFSAVVLELIDALKLGPVPVYGTHTGAAIAVECAKQRPDLISATILDGYAIFTDVERDQLLASYLPPFRPSLDGSLATWLWARVRDQFTAFPWNQVGDGSKLSFGPPSLRAMQGVVDDFLLADDQYRVGYSAAFRYDHHAPLPQVDRPVYIVTRKDDLLFSHMERARGAGGHVTLKALSADRDEWGAAIKELAERHAGSGQLSAAKVVQRAGVHPGTRYIANTSAGPVICRIDGTGDTLVLLHDIPGGMADLDHLAERLRQSHRVVRVNLPGFGASRLADGVKANIAMLTAGVAEALVDIGADKAPLIACGASLPVATTLPGTPEILALDPWPQVAQDAAGHLPDLAPSWDGAHLLAAFWWARDYEIYKPWYNRVNTELRKIGSERDAARIHHRFRANTLSGQIGVELARLLYQTDASADLSALTSRVRILVYDSDPDADALMGWAEQTVGLERIERVPRPPEQLAPVLADMCR
ncbi:MAG: alpha/beta fold hydrolase [Geminicoccaceae bacterium]